MRKLTADLLGYDLANLTSAQSIRLDRAAALRLELDDIQSRQLAGLTIDMTKYVAASEALERLVGGDPERPTQNDFSKDAAELSALLNLRYEAIKRRRAVEAAAVAAAAAEPQALPGTVQNTPPESLLAD